MPEFQGLPRAVLVAISRASGESYKDIDGRELMAELASMGHEPEPTALRDLMFRLRDDGFVEMRASGFGAGPEGMALIRLGLRGRQEVEGWPTGVGPSPADIQALIAVLLEQADDPDVPEPQRGKLRAAGEALRDVGVEVTGNVVTTWLRSLGAL
jgi:hypothetical protein